MKMQTEFLNEVSKYIDADGLIGDKPYPEPQSTGNPLVLTAIALMLAKKFDVLNEKIFSERIKSGVLSLLNKDGVPNKKMRSNDNASHDDYLGFVVCAKILGLNDELKKFVEYGRKNFWYVSNNGRLYWDALQKRWDVATYELATFGKTNPVNYLFLISKIVFDTIFMDNDFSGIQKNYLRLNATEDVFIMKKLKTFFLTRLKKKHGGVSGLMRGYYGENHPYTIFFKKTNE